MGYDEELTAEQAHVDRAYARLEALRGFASELAAESAAASGGTFAERFERDVRIGAGLSRLDLLRPDARPLCFGRLDRLDGERFHLGRVGVIDADGEPLVVDWRAPVAEPFYRATVGEPLGVARRRHLRGRGRTVTGLDDELLVGAGDVDAIVDGDDGLVGQAALLRALSAARTGRMGDIVSTIQGEQDAVIRAPLPGVLVVQGGPGTGKTAVALHRVAYLLYAHRLRLGRHGVLVVGPNPVFLRYIDQVLPSLGETGIRLAMPHQLVTGRVATATEDAGLARHKGDARMATVLARAVRLRQRTPRADVEVPWGARLLTFTVEDARRIRRAARRRPGSHNSRRPWVEAAVLRVLRARARERAQAAVDAGIGGPESVRVRTFDLASSLASEPRFRELLERLWPRLSPGDVLADLYTRGPFRAAAAKDLFEPDEAERLARPGTSEDGPWTAADAVLLDELAALLGPVDERPGADEEDDDQEDDGLTPEQRQFVDRGLAAAEVLPDCRACGSELTFAGDETFVCELAGCDAEWRADQVMKESHFLRFLEVREVLVAQVREEGPSATDDRFGHVVVDEAQELSPMQWRVLARRCPTGSMTIVGDLGQAAWDAPASWTELLSVLPERWPVQVAELTVNYRTPSEVAALAAAVLREARPELTPPRAVRDAGVVPEAVLVPDPTDLVSEADRLARAAAVAGGRVAVLLAPSVDASAAGGVDDGDPAALDRPVARLHPEAAKGLEFDVVVLVEPAALTDRGAVGWRDLYVAMTRTTARLIVVHSRPLPGPLVSLG